VTPLRVYIGYDEREHDAAVAALKSLKRFGLDAELLCESRLRSYGLYWRLGDERAGQDYDLASNETKSTRFKFTRFLVPALAQSGYALFADCDVIFKRSPLEILHETPRSQFAVSVVKHEHQPAETVKMHGVEQKAYPRKNWSSVMLFNCDHPANRRLSIRDINERTAAELHAFYWLADDEIGTLDPAWNWLVDVQPRPERVGIAHLTLGGPWIKGWKGGSFDAEWREEAARR
jgi:hypothetical protein